MPADSLVLFAVVVGWVLFLVPRWLTHRDAAMSARVNDRHSTRLRVLTRRPRRSSHIATNKVLRAETGVVDRGATGGSAVEESHRGARASQSTDGLPLIIPAARLRALVLALLSMAVVASAALALGGVASWWIAAVLFGLWGLDCLVLVFTARQRRLRQRQACAVSQRVTTVSRRIAARQAAQRAVHQGAEVYDDVHVEALEVARRSERRYGGRGSQWTPVAVPPPVYTMKPQAPRAPRVDPEVFTSAAPRRPRTPVLSVVLGDSNGSEPAQVDARGGGTPGGAAGEVTTATDSQVRESTLTASGYNWADGLDDVLARRAANG